MSVLRYWHRGFLYISIVQWLSVDADGNESTLLAPARQGHCDDPVGGQPSPPTVTPVWHDDAVEGPEWDDQTHSTVRCAERKRRQLVAKEEREVTSRVFSTYECPLQMVNSFRYLRRVISAADNDWLLLLNNLFRARAVWRRTTRILGREGAALWVSVFFDNSVVQAVFLFGSETWVVIPRLGKALVGFQAQVARRLAVPLPQRTPEGKCTYTLVETAREEAEFLTMEEYIRRRQNIVAQYIATWSLLYLFEGTERASGAQLGMWWWEQAGLNLAGAREAEAAAAERDWGEDL